MDDLPEKLIDLCEKRIMVENGEKNNEAYEMVNNGLKASDFPINDIKHDLLLEEYKTRIKIMLKKNENMEIFKEKFKNEPLSSISVQSLENLYNVLIEK